MLLPDEKQPINFRRIVAFLARSKDTAIKGSIAVVLVATLGVLFPSGESIEEDYKVGAIWAQKDLITPFSFPIFRDEREYARDIDEARKSVFQVFERDTLVTEQQINRLGTFFKQLDTAVRARTEYRRSLRRHRQTLAEDSALFNRLATGLDIPFSEREWDVLGSLAAENQLAEMSSLLVGAVQEYLRTGILDRAKNTMERDELALRRGNQEEIVPAARLLDQNDVVSLLEKRLLDHYGSRSSVISVAYKIGIMHVAPNVRFNASATEQAIASAVDAVPRTTGFVQENERIVSKHERITQEIKLKLDALRRAKAERGSAADRPTQLLGTMLHVAMVVTLYGIYLFLFRKRIFGNNRRLALIALLILFEGLVAYLTREMDVAVPVEYLIVVPVASMLLTIIFDSRVGFYGTVIVAFLVAGIRGNDYSIALASLVAGALSVYSVRDMKIRTQIFRSLGFIFVGYALTIVALGLERFESVPVVLEQLMFGLVNAVISPVLTYGFLIFIERVFNVTTDLTLLELAHFNHPLLRMLSEKAPGTYHHSMTMASLAEAAASAVGANEVLVRVGAYFHDVGKIVKPTYFVENQKGSRNRHDKLAPRMSSLIIGAHVKDGIALAQEYHVPEEVIDFIPMHHGTTRMDYFYTKALQLAQNSPDETKLAEIKEQDYRYPGPRPHTKETGIMMLADAIEAVVRSIEDPTPQRLEATIDELIKKRFEEGELDDCPLTLRDLTKIKAAFLAVLVGVYHSRVKYPSVEKKRVRRPKPQPADPLASAQEGSGSPSMEGGSG